MTVEQYLKIFNNLPDDKPLPERISVLRLHCGPLNLSYASLYDNYRGGIGGIGDECFVIRDGYIKYMYAEWDGQFWRPLCFSNGISLHDDISLHCGQYGTPRDLIKEAIKTLENLIDQFKKGWLLSDTPNADDFEIAANRFRFMLIEEYNLDDSPKEYRR